MAAWLPCRVAPAAGTGVLLALLCALLGVGADSPGLRGGAAWGDIAIAEPQRSADAHDAAGEAVHGRALTDVCQAAYTPQYGGEMPAINNPCSPDLGCSGGAICTGKPGKETCSQLVGPKCPCKADQINGVCDLTSGTITYQSSVGGQCVADTDCAPGAGPCCQPSFSVTIGGVITTCAHPGTCLGWGRLGAACAGNGTSCGVDRSCSAGRCVAMLNNGDVCVGNPQDSFMGQAALFSINDPWKPFYSIFDYHPYSTFDSKSLPECGLFGACLKASATATTGTCVGLLSRGEGTFVGVPPATTAGDVSGAATAAALGLLCAPSLILDPTSGSCVQRKGTGTTNGNCAVGQPGQEGVCPALQGCMCIDAAGVAKICSFSTSEYRFWGTRGAVPYVAKQVAKIEGAVGGLISCAYSNCNGLMPGSMALQMCLLNNCSTQFAGIPCSLYQKSPDPGLVTPLGICCRALVFNLDWASVNANPVIPNGFPPYCCGGADSVCSFPLLNCPVPDLFYVAFAIGIVFIVGCCWFWWYCCYCRKKEWFTDNCTCDKVLHCKCCGCCCEQCMDDNQRRKRTMRQLEEEEKQAEIERVRAEARGENYYKKNPLRDAGGGKGKKKKGAAGDGEEDGTAAASPAGEKKKKKKSKGDGTPLTEGAGPDENGGWAESKDNPVPESGGGAVLENDAAVANNDSAAPTGESAAEDATSGKDEAAAGGEKKKKKKKKKAAGGDSAATADE